MFDTATPLLSHIRRLAKAGPSGAPTDRECLARFAAEGDEAAFETLVIRHGPMVLRVCRSVLGDPHAAEDAFQATFLILARRVSSVRKHQSLGSWLFKVARRIALRDKASACLRRRREGSAACRQGADPVDEVSWREVQAIFFDELGRMAERYRAPLVLCWTEGKTRDEAACQLGLAPATLKKRLERGRKLLRHRLTRRGLALSAGVIASRVSAGTVLPPMLVRAAVRAGTAGRAPGVAARSVPPEVERLASHVASSALFGRLRLVASAVLVAGAIVASGVGLYAEGRPTDKPVGGEKRPGQQPASARTDAQGDPLPAGAISRLGSLRMRHGRFVDYVRYLPGGKTLLSMGGDSVRIWDVATGEQVRELPRETIGMPDPVAPLSPDGKLLVTVGESGIGLVDVATGKKTRTLGSGGYTAARWSPDGKLIAAHTRDLPGAVEVLEVATGRQLWSKSFDRLPLFVLAFSPDGSTLIAGGRIMLELPPAADHGIYLVDARTGEQRRRIETGTRNPLRIMPSPDGSQLLAICREENRPSSLCVWDVQTGKELRQIVPPENKHDRLAGYFSALAFTPSGKSFVTAGRVDQLVEWDLATGKELRRFGRGTMHANDIAFSPDGKTVALAGTGASVRLYDWASGEDRSPGGGNPMQITDVSVTPNGRTVVTSGFGPTLLCWDPFTGRVRHRYRPEEDDSPYFRLTADGRSAVGEWTGEKTLIVRDATSGALRSRVELDIAANDLVTLAVSPGGEVAAVKGYAQDVLSLVDTATGKVLKTLNDPALRGCTARFSAGGRTLFAFCGDYTAQVWDVTRAKKLRQFELQGVSDPPAPAPGGAVLPVPIGTTGGGPHVVAVSPDGERIAIPDQNAHLLLLDGVTGEEVWRTDGLANKPSVLAFSADGRMLAWAGWPGTTVHLLEVATGKERRLFAGHRGPPYAFAFAADASFLVSGGLDTTAVVWDLTGRLAPGSPQPGSLNAAELDSCWAALQSKDATAAFNAIQELGASPARAAPYLGERLRPHVPADTKLVAGLIGELDSDAFETRAKAARRLEELGGADVIAACRKELAGKPSAEARRRLDEIVQKLSRKWRNPAGGELRTLRALEVLERIGTPEAQRVLRSIANGVPDAPPTVEAKAALGRLASRPASP
jgi:RNA polymerase sigma factor (sigma-70 family)